ncbi:hypothetical protein BOTBODRAFT_369655 [Botryobasidium botryosum FD-172 SS1]|uniref:Uncharacterized protein n=1 Tax=Botryobasidium botryosum (strain FD-172 SS1) TaxID=930990 RepID=A0A067MCM1_BOTB1|nr:hypothetical protein BOTBODRAFT_369655 [Botryobasidium botryosum FD-172 SS1]
MPNDLSWRLPVRNRFIWRLLARSFERAHASSCEFVAISVYYAVAWDPSSQLASRAQSRVRRGDLGVARSHLRGFSREPKEDKERLPDAGG